VPKASFSSMPGSCGRRYEQFCSAFVDVDSAFGSIGSFFSFEPSQGSFEVNPPFVPETMHAAVVHAERLLRSADEEGRSMSFVFIVPTWEPLPFWQQLRSSRWRTAELLLLDAESHAFVDGAQHLKEDADRFRPSSFGTTVAILQTRGGAAQWPVSDELLSAIRGTFEAALPSSSDMRARMQRGGSDAVAKLMARRGDGDSDLAISGEGKSAAPALVRADRQPVVEGQDAAASAQRDMGVARKGAKKSKRRLEELNMERATHTLMGDSPLPVKARKKQR
jgi:hypothetical protein